MPRSKADEYRAALAGEPNPEPYALAHSGLPGPRANLELIGVLADISSEPTLRRWADLSATDAPGDQPEVILVAAEIVGLARFIDKRPDVFALLHDRSRDPRWRVREAVAISLQDAGAADPAGLVRRLRPWVEDSDPLVQRAVVAALCEPALLRDEAVAARVIEVLDEITGSLAARPTPRSEPERVLRQALGYGWSVAIVGSPATGKATFERWIDDDDPDIRWILRENLRKARLRAVDAAWVAHCTRRLSA